MIQLRTLFDVYCILLGWAIQGKEYSVLRLQLLKGFLSLKYDIWCKLLLSLISVEKLLPILV